MAVFHILTINTFVFTTLMLTFNICIHTLVQIKYHEKIIVLELAGLEIVQF